MTFKNFHISISYKETMVFEFSCFSWDLLSAGLKILFPFSKDTRFVISFANPVILKIP